MLGCDSSRMWQNLSSVFLVGDKPGFPHMIERRAKPASAWLSNPVAGTHGWRSTSPLSGHHGAQGWYSVLAVDAVDQDCHKH